MDLAKKIISRLKLKPLEKEGGYFFETYRSGERINNLPKRYGGRRNFSTAIYYLLTPDLVSKIHKVKSDEIFHFYWGDPVEILMLFADGTSKIAVLGNELFRGQAPQIVVEKGVWQGARLKKGGRFALLGTTVAPGFEYKDFKLAERKTLLKKYPAYKKFIKELTPDD
jgi:predicted cupin superfamily sugar epimerase